MAAAAILKNRKIAISRPRFDRFRPNLSRRRSSALLSCPTVKSLKLEKSKMAAVAISATAELLLYSFIFSRPTHYIDKLLTATDQKPQKS